MAARLNGVRVTSFPLIFRDGHVKRLADGVWVMVGNTGLCWVGGDGGRGLGAGRGLGRERGGAPGLDRLMVCRMTKLILLSH